MAAAATAEIIQFPVAGEFAVRESEQFSLLADLAVTNAAILVPVDSIPDLRQARIDADIESAEIFESRMSQVREGDTDQVPYEVDPVSTALLCVATRERWGEDSAEYQTLFKGLGQDCLRFSTERLQKMKPVYFPEIRLDYTPDLQDYVSNGVSTVNMARNGITPLSDSHEVPRRYMEHREAVTQLRYGQLAMKAAGVELVADADIPEVALPAEIRNSPSTHMITLSLIPQAVRDKHLQDKAAGKTNGRYGPYTVAIDKFMIRGMRFDPEEGCAYLEQMGVPGTYITPEVIAEALVEADVLAVGEAPSRDDLLGLQMLSDKGVISMLRRLDVAASRTNGLNIFKGEIVSANHPKEYETISTEAVEQEAQAEAISQDMAQFLIELAESGIDHWEANSHVEKYAEDMIFNEVKDSPERAAVAYDENTSTKLQEAITARTEGRYGEANLLVAQAKAEAPPLEGCGAVCGIISLDAKSGIASLAKSKGLEAGDDGTVLVDTIRACVNRSCMKKALVYSVIKGEVGKVCLACGLLQKHGRKVEQPDNLHPATHSDPKNDELAAKRLAHKGDLAAGNTIRPDRRVLAAVA